MSRVLERLVDRIPEAIFDLIARMLPGGILVAMMSSSVQLPGLPSLLIPCRDDKVGILVFLVFAYTAGLAVSAFSWILNCVSWFIVFPMLSKTAIETLSEASEKHSLGLKQLSFCKPIVAMDVFARVHDYVKAHAPKERSLALKLHAEVTLLYSLTVVFFVACVYEKYQLSNVIVAVALFFAGVIRSIRTWQRHASILRAIDP